MVIMGAIAFFKINSNWFIISKQLISCCIIVELFLVVFDDYEVAD